MKRNSGDCMPSRRLQSGKAQPQRQATMAVRISIMIGSDKHTSGNQTTTTPPRIAFEYQAIDIALLGDWSSPHTYQHVASSCCFQMSGSCNDPVTRAQHRRFIPIAGGFGEH
jgi:hypothetical protein